MAWLDNSRILAIYAVVLLHVAAGVVLGNEVGSQYWWVGNFYDSAVRWCVPVLVMISGALLLDPGKTEDLITFYRKRLSRILIPLIVWSLFFLGWSAFKTWHNGGDAVTADLTRRLLSGKPYFHMWFLYMIIGLYLFTPFFRKIVANSTKQELIFLVAIGFVVSALNSAYGKTHSSGTTLFINWFLPYIPYFLLGHLIREDKKHHASTHLWFVFVLSLLFTSSGCYFVATKIDLSMGLYFYDYLSVTVIPMSISIMYLLKTLEKPIFNTALTKKLSILTLGIYLIHPAFIELIDHMGYGANNHQSIISVPFVASAAFLMSLAVAWSIHHVPIVKRII